MNTKYEFVPAIDWGPQMGKVRRLAEAVGFDDAKIFEAFLVENTEVSTWLQKFYTLASADLGAELVASRELAQSYAEERNELQVDNAKLRKVLSNTFQYIGKALEAYEEAYGVHPDTDPVSASIKEDLNAARAALE